jgi:hypothetical protein
VGGTGLIRLAIFADLFFGVKYEAVSGFSGCLRKQES